MSGSRLAFITLMGVIMSLNPTNPGRSQEDIWAEPRQQMLLSVANDAARNSHVLGRAQLSPAVAKALALTPRHEFVPSEYRHRAYENCALPIGQGQTISQPTIVALMTDLLQVGPEDTVLEVGTGSGYQAAVLAGVVGQVETIEIVPELARSARKRLDRLGYHNVRVHEGDGYMGLPEMAPFDGIMVTAAAARVPGPLLEQLKPGARLVIPVGPAAYTQQLTVWTRDEAGLFHEEKLLPVRFVPLVRKGEN
nr:protein-L-isoaspartate(D-aspartate) O-methyltransferase [Candidatus Krumholzibacteria bacterium]